MRRGKYFQHAEKLLNYIYEHEFSVDFSIENKCSKLANKLDIPKASFFDVLHWLENNNLLEIDRKRVRLYEGLWISHINRIRLTRKGVIYYFNILNLNSD